MSVKMIQERLDGYRCRSTLEEDHALREITQEIVLAGLGRTTFFNHAAFHGGTCLRIFHGLNRFSEDLDFALMAPDAKFSLQSFLSAVRDEVSAYGCQLEIDDRSRLGQAVQKAFVKESSLGGVLRLNYRPSTGPMRKIRIKLEVDTNPPLGANWVMPILDFPFASAVKTHDLPSLFAGKMHALLCREYHKGRDWYDLVWYTAQRVPINHRLLDAALDQQGPWRGTQPKTDATWCVARIRERIEVLDVDQLRHEVLPFVKAEEQPSLSLWSADFFRQQVGKLTMPGTPLD